jgi:hypothetical protein
VSIIEELQNSDGAWARLSQVFATWGFVSASFHNLIFELKSMKVGRNSDGQ